MLTQSCFVGKRLFNAFVFIAEVCEYFCLRSDAFNTITYTYLRSKQTQQETEGFVALLVIVMVL